MSCSALLCSSRTTFNGQKTAGISFHLFPTYTGIKNQWIEAIGRENWKPNKHDRLCSKHFEDSCFVEGLKRKRLNPDAVPTIFERTKPKIAKKRILTLRRDTSVPPSFTLTSKAYIASTAKLIETSEGNFQGQKLACREVLSDATNTQVALASTSSKKARFPICSESDGNQKVEVSPTCATTDPVMEHDTYTNKPSTSLKSIVIPSRMTSKKSEAPPKPNYECRACLKKTPPGLAHNIFQPWEPSFLEYSSTIAAELAILAKVEISDSNEYSKYICKNCYSRLCAAFTLMNDVKNSEQILRNRVLGVEISPDKSWPKPIQLHKSINEEVLGSSMEIDIKQEVVSDEECGNSQDDDRHDNAEILDIKIEPEEITEQQLPIQVTVNGTISQAQLDQISSMTNGCEVYENEEYLESMSVKEEPMSEDEAPADLPLECMLCAKMFNTVSGLKAHVIAYHNYKTVKRKSDGSGSPAKLKHESDRHICATCRRIFTTSTDLKVHEVCHDKFCCFACNSKFDSFKQVTQHCRRCKAKSQDVKPKTLGDVMRERAQAVTEAKQKGKSLSEQHLQCLKCKVSFKDKFYFKLHNAIQHPHKETEKTDEKIKATMERMRENENLERTKIKIEQDMEKYNKIEIELESIFEYDLERDGDSDHKVIDSTEDLKNDKENIAQGDNVELKLAKTESDEAKETDRSKKETTSEIERNKGKTEVEQSDNTYKETADLKEHELSKDEIVNNITEENDVGVTEQHVEGIITKEQLEKNRQTDKAALIECLEHS